MVALALCVPNVGRRPDNTNRLYTLALLYLRQAAAGAGHEVTLVDAYFRELGVAETSAALLASGPLDVLGFTLNSEEMADAALQVAAAVTASQGRRPVVIAGGYYPSLKGRDVLTRYPGFDYLVRGEGEHTLVELLARLQEPAAIAGVISHRSEGPRRPPISELDALGELDFHHCDEPPRAEELSLVTRRDCSAACSYCPIGALWGRYQHWRGHSARWVVDQLERLVRDRGASYVQLVDDQFVGTPESIERAWEIAALMRDRGLRVPFYFMSRVDTVCAHPELFATLADVGLDRVFLGIESGSQDALDAWRKQATVDQAERAVAILDAAGISAAAGTIVFRPNMTRESILRDLALLERLAQQAPRFVFYGLNELDILEGTPLGAAHGELDWMLDWRSPDPAVQRIYRHWREVQALVLFPAIRLLPLARNLRVRRALCRWQIDTLRALVACSVDRSAPDWPELTSSMARLVLAEAGSRAVTDFLVKREALMSSSRDHLPEAERCFD